MDWKYEWLKWRYPLTIVYDRYAGAYSDGNYLAFPLEFNEVPEEVNGEDGECGYFWNNYDEPVGKGATVQEAIDDLVEKMKEQESEDEKTRKEIIEYLKLHDKGEDDYAHTMFSKWFAYLEKQKYALEDGVQFGKMQAMKEIPMPDSTELIEMWDAEKAMLQEKDFQGDTWRIAYNAFMDGFARGTCVKFEKQKEQKPAECIPDSVKFDEGFKTGRESGLRDGQKYVLDNAESYGLCKPVEWSEEDEKMRQSILNLISITFSKTYRKEINWLKSLPLNLKKKNEDVAKLCSTEWSEEDEDKIMSIKNLITTGKFADTNTIRIIWDMLESLRPQPKQEWTEEDEKMLNKLITRINTVQLLARTDSTSLNFSFFNEIGWLKLLRNRYAFKPSEEQLRALKYVAYHLMPDENYRDEMFLLYEQLKKLTEE